MRDQHSRLRLLTDAGLERRIRLQNFDTRLLRAPARVALTQLNRAPLELVSCTRLLARSAESLEQLALAQLLRDRREHRFELRTKLRTHVSHGKDEICLLVGRARSERKLAFVDELLARGRAPIARELLLELDTRCFGLFECDPLRRLCFEDSFELRADLGIRGLLDIGLRDLAGRLRRVRLCGLDTECLRDLCLDLRIVEGRESAQRNARGLAVWTVQLDAVFQLARRLERALERCVLHDSILRFYECDAFLIRTALHE